MTLLEKILIELKELNSKIENIEETNISNNPRTLNGKANLTTTEAIKLLGIGRNKLLELAHSKSIPHINNGSKFLFPVDQLFNWIDNKAANNYITEEKSEIKNKFRNIT